MKGFLKAAARVIIAGGAGFAVGKFICQPIFKKVGLY